MPAVLISVAKHPGNCLLRSSAAAWIKPPNEDEDLIGVQGDLSHIACMFCVKIRWKIVLALLKSKKPPLTITVDRCPTFPEIQQRAKAMLGQENSSRQHTILHREKLSKETKDAECDLGTDAVVSSAEELSIAFSTALVSGRFRKVLFVVRLDELKSFTTLTAEDAMKGVCGCAFVPGSRPDRKALYLAVPPFVLDEAINDTEASEWSKAKMNEPKLQVRDLVKHALRQLGIVACAVNSRARTESTQRLYIDPLVLCAMHIAFAVLDLEDQQLTLDLEASVTGDTVYGRMDYLVGFEKMGVAVLEAKLDDVMAHEPQLLGQMAYIEEKQASSSAGSCAGSKRKRDTFGILTNGDQWSYYRHEQGSGTVIYAQQHLNIRTADTAADYAGQVPKVLESLVGIMIHQISNMLGASPAKKPRVSCK